MKKNTVFWCVIVVSVALHFIIGSLFSIRIEGPQVPSVFCWSNVVKKDDLLGGFNRVKLPKGISLDNFDLQRQYFSSSFSPLNRIALAKGGQEHYPKTPSILLENQVGGFIYLWEKPPLFSILAQERVPYRLYVSNHGKILVSYPQQLTYNTTDGLILQQYLRESTLFTGDKLSWTNIEGVIK